MMAATERLRLARELHGVNAELRSRGTVMDPLRRVAMARKVMSLRALLTGERVNSITNLDLFAPLDSVRVMRAHLDGLKDAAPDERRQMAAYIAILAERASMTAHSQGDIDVSAAAEGLKREAASIAEGPGEDAFAETVKERYRQLGTDEVVELIPRIEQANADASLVTEEFKAFKAERQEALDEFSTEMIKLKSVCEARYEEVRAGTMTPEQYRPFAEAYKAEYKRRTEEMNARFDGKIDAINERQRQVDARVAEVSDEFKAALLSKSAVTQEAADAWAEAQRVEPSAKAALKRIGYELPKLRADIAEFYRLTGGRLAKVRIKASRGRASASDIHGYRNRTISMGDGFSKRTLWHELGHHLEADPEVYAASLGFLLARRENDTLHTLRKLTGNDRYGAKEVAYKDSFYSPYVGKVYPYRVTEVMSMGMEAFATGAILAHVMSIDPEHIRLMTGFIKSSPHPMFAGVKKVFEQAADAEAEADKVKEATSEDALKQLARGVEFTPGDPPPLAHQPYGRDTAKQYLGSYHGLQLWRFDKVRDPQTNRCKKGFYLAHAEQDGTMFAPSGGVVPRIVVRTAKAFSMDEAKAVARVWARTAELRALPRDHRQLQQFAAAYAA